MIKGQQAQRAQAHNNNIYYISFSQNIKWEIQFSLKKTLLSYLQKEAAVLYKSA